MTADDQTTTRICTKYSLFNSMGSRNYQIMVFSILWEVETIKSILLTTTKYRGFYVACN